MAELVQAVANEEESPASSTVDMHVISLSECFVYKVPPLRSASGHRAEDWGLEHPLFTGCLKIYQNDDRVSYSLFTVDRTQIRYIN
ncbi:DUF1681 domain-containing protein [archaeon]|nr:MAG: DUF1681 domain-containing protein [archaeon]